MRHEDANLQLAKKCGAGFHKAAQYQPDVTVFVYQKQSTYLRLDRALLMRLGQKGAALASKKQLSVPSKAISRMSQYMFSLSRT